MEPTPILQPAAFTGPHLFNLSNVQQFYGRAGADETVAAYWKSLPANVFLQATRRGSALLAPTVHLLPTGDVIPTRAPHEGPYRITGTERIFPAAKELGEYLLAQRAALVPAEGAATVIDLDGSLSEIHPAKGGKSFKFEQLRPLIGAETLDIHRFDHGPLAGYILVLDDNGKYNGSALNMLATACWFDTYPPAHYSPIDIVVGTVVLMRTELIR